MLLCSLLTRSYQTSFTDGLIRLCNLSEKDKFFSQLNFTYAALDHEPHQAFLPFTQPLPHPPSAIASISLTAASANACDDHFIHLPESPGKTSPSNIYLSQSPEFFQLFHHHHTCHRKIPQSPDMRAPIEHPLHLSASKSRTFLSLCHNIGVIIGFDVFCGQ